MKGVVIEGADKLYSDGIAIGLDQGSFEEAAIPDGDKAPRSTSGGGEEELVKMSWAKIL